MLVYARKKLCKQRPCVDSEHIRFSAESDTSRDVAHNLLVSGAIGFHVLMCRYPFQFTDATRSLPTILPLGPW